MIRKISAAFMITFLMLPAGICQNIVETPTNVSLSAEENSITVTWDGDADDDSYTVYWGEDEDNLDNSRNISETEGEEFSIEGLKSGTVYWVSVSAWNNNEESELSDPESIETGSDTEAPEVPTGFGVTSTDSITSTSVGLKWDENTESDLDFYRIQYGTASRTYDAEIEIDAGDDTTASATNLTNSERYYFTITAVDTSDNASDRAAEIIVDTLQDTNPPNVPDGVSAELTDVQSITVEIEGGNENMADFAGNIIYYGQTSGQLDQSVDIGRAGSRTFTDLPVNSTWFFAASAYDSSDNESDTTAEVSATIEETQSFLNRKDDFEGGCFVGSLWDSEKNYEPAEKKNKVGAAVGYYLPEQSEFEDFYGDENYPVFLFYDRLITDHISVDLKAGYLDRSGKLLTLGGQPTGVASDFTMVPVAASINYNYPINRHIWVFAGLGPDYWFVEEETKGASAMETSDWVGGYHARTGLWLFNRDTRYQNWGGLIEVDYSRIDRFGGNDSDVGGWFFLVGLFYGF